MQHAVITPPILCEAVPDKQQQPTIQPNEIRKEKEAIRIATYANSQNVSSVRHTMYVQVYASTL